MQFNADSLGIDTAELRIAVMPTMSCLPVYYAKRSGLADSLGLRIKLLHFQAQMDVDTAILARHTDIAFTDLIRCARMNKANASVKPFSSCDESLSLISLEAKQVKQVKQMKEQMIAVSRLSATDFWCDRLLDSTKTSHDDIYRPQVNDVWLRAEMLRQGLVDAAMMGEPYATWMTLLGHKRLFHTQGKQPKLYAWANISASKQQEDAFLCMVDSAIACIERNVQEEVVRSILKGTYQLPPAMVDSMELQPIPNPTPISPSDTLEALKWLESKKTRK